MTHLRTWLADRVDALACRAAIWGLTRIWGRCRPPYDDGCMGCRVGSVCDELEAIMRGRLGAKP